MGMSSLGSLCQGKKKLKTVNVRELLGDGACSCLLSFAVKGDEG